MAFPTSWIDKYVWYGHEKSPMAPKIYHETVAMHCLSSVLGRSVFFDRKAKSVYPNLWAVILGPPGTAKKSTALDYGRSLLEDVAPEMQMADCSSMEGLIAELAEKSSAGICHVWSNQDEFGSIVSGMKRKDYLADLKDIYMQLYDGKKLSRRLIKTSYKIDPVYMTFISASTLHRLSGLLTPDDLEDGFLSRFLLVYASDNGYIDDGDPDPLLTKLRSDLEYDLSQVRTAYGSYKTEMVWDKEAKMFFSAWKADLDAQVRFKAFPPSCAARMEDYFIKMCMLWEMSDSMKYLGDKHVISADRTIDVADRIVPYMDSMKLMFERLGADRNVELVFNIIESANDEGILYRDILRRSKLNIRKLSDVMETLRLQERVKQDLVHDGSRGRPRARFFARYPGESDGESGEENT